MSSEFGLIVLAVVLSFTAFFCGKYILSKLSIFDKIKEYLRKLSQ